MDKTLTLIKVIVWSFFGILTIAVINYGYTRKEVIKEYELVQCGFITKCLPLNRYPTKETCEAMIKMQDQAMLVYACLEKDKNEDDTF